MLKLLEWIAIAIAILVGTAFIGLLAFAYFHAEAGCPDYGIIASQESPGKRWIADIGVDGCAMGGSTYITLREEGQAWDRSIRNRVINLPDFPNVSMAWVTEDEISVSLPPSIETKEFPSEWRGKRITYRRFDNDVPARRNVTIAHGVASYSD